MNEKQERVYEILRRQIEKGDLVDYSDEYLKIMAVEIAASTVGEQPTPEQTEKMKPGPGVAEYEKFLNDVNKPPPPQQPDVEREMFNLLRRVAHAFGQPATQDGRVLDDVIQYVLRREAVGADCAIADLGTELDMARVEIKRLRDELAGASSPVKRLADEEVRRITDEIRDAGSAWHLAPSEAFYLGLMSGKDFYEGKQARAVRELNPTPTPQASTPPASTVEEEYIPIAPTKTVPGIWLPQSEYERLLAGASRRRVTGHNGPYNGPNGITDEELAKTFHDKYEELAPTFGWVTREETRRFDPTSTNGRLMVAVARAVRDACSGEVKLPGEDVRERYDELLYAVGSKWPNESRHETALRYIRQAEMPQNNPSQQAKLNEVKG